MGKVDYLSYKQRTARSSSKKKETERVKTFGFTWSNNIHSQHYVHVTQTCAVAFAWHQHGQPANKQLLINRTYVVTSHPEMLYRQCCLSRAQDIHQALLSPIF